MGETIKGRFAAALAALDAIEPLEVFGRVTAVKGLLVEVSGPVEAMRLGGRLDIGVDRGGVVPAR